MRLCAFHARAIDFNREYDLSKAREVGFHEEVDTVEGYRIAFERMKNAKILPEEV